MGRRSRDKPLSALERKQQIEGANRFLRERVGLLEDRLLDRVYEKEGLQKEIEELKKEVTYTRKVFRYSLPKQGDQKP